ncbi:MULTISPECIES: diacylglycerol/lipid kinase family protein [unclassified Brevibacterium]|uniref:diacylglycerol/lipid kinase family protein n=1 Tax=unclassified Brevibacterium TaxID=2614124 RepID=UPI003624BA67
MTFDLDPAMMWLVIVGLVVIVCGAFLLGNRIGSRRILKRLRRYSRRPELDDDGVEEYAPNRYRAALIVNPTKASAGRIASTAEAICRFEGWNPPLILETTPEDAGEGLARLALEEGVDVVIAAGGDGTIRAVASALAGTSTPMGIVPLGTGNLLARNLDLVLDKPEWALRIALWGRNRAVDVGTAQISPGGPTLVFMVMTGLGFDAEVMAKTTANAKSRLGWLAYLEAGSRTLVGRPSHVKITYDDDYRVTARVRSVIGGNCGKLQGGIQLLPEAIIDDGLLDVLVVSPKNLGQWVGVVASIIGRRTTKGLHTDIRKCHNVVIESKDPLEVQLDGDPLGTTGYLAMAVDPGAITVRVPTTEQRREIRAEAWPV